MTTSHWRRSARPEVLERDLAVVGAGICGLSAGVHLARRGARTAILERASVGSGASARNAGFLMRGASDNYASAVRTYGRERARLLWRWTEENLEGLRGEGIERTEGFRDAPSCLLALQDHELAELRTSATMLREDGFEVEWVERGEDSVWRSSRSGAAGGLVNPHDAACDPARVLQLLTTRLTDPVIEDQEVIEIRGVGTGKGVEVLTGNLRVRCSRVLICTNAYGPLLVPSLRGRIVPRRGQMLAARAAGARLDYSYYANHGSEYFRLAADGVVVGGGFRAVHGTAEEGYEDAVTAPVQRDIEQFLERMLDARIEVISRWSGTMGFSADGLPIVGPLEGDWVRGSVWYCGGFTGHGMSMAYRTAAAAVDGILDGTPVPLPLSGVPTGVST